MESPGYRQHLRTVVASSAAPYGYTLTVWTAGAITTHAVWAFPTAADALMLLAGAVAGFGAVGLLAYGSMNRVLATRAPSAVRVWAGLHLPSVGLSIVLVAGLTTVIHGWAIWLAVGFTATSVYLLVIGAQFMLAHRLGGDR